MDAVSVIATMSEIVASRESLPNPAPTAVSRRRSGSLLFPPPLWGGKEVEAEGRFSGVLARF